MLILLAPAVLADDKPGQEIIGAEEHQVIEAPQSNFSGAANFSRFPVMSSPGDVAPATVTFEAGTVTNWHIHPHGQYLIVIEGEGRTQEWGKPIQTIKAGDVVVCPPGVKHWHGASEHSSMTHIAISPVAPDSATVEWLEPVDLPGAEPASTDQPKREAKVTLTQQQLSLIPIAAFSATGDLDKLKPALVQGLERGLTISQINEALAHQYAYAGFPRSLNAMLTFRSLLEDRQSNGIRDDAGQEPSPLPANTDFYQRGIETLAHLRNTSVADESQPLFDNFSPTIDYALKAHLFGYLFSRNNLGYLERELVVVATLAAFGDVNAQLDSHLRITQNLGVGEDQMNKIMTTLEKEVGTDVAGNARSVLKGL